uniref:Uncharacterized protein LOC100185777 n=1 Tax=Phallusia mammillata TaxID=59560 RepID=A0A6F9DJ67_9ASCI|nr:uncharacterized protein LOC100185777 [Phallusia mammillata]
MLPSKKMFLIWRCCFIAMGLLGLLAELRTVTGYRSRQRATHSSLYKFSPTRGIVGRGLRYTPRKVYTNSYSRPTSSRSYLSPTVVHRYSVTPTRGRVTPTRRYFGGSTQMYPPGTRMMKIPHGMKFVYKTRRQFGPSPRYPTKSTGGKYRTFLRSTARSNYPSSTSHRFPTPRVSSPTVANNAKNKATRLDSSTNFIPQVVRSPTRVPTRLYTPTTASSPRTAQSSPKNLFDVEPQRTKHENQLLSGITRVSKPTHPSSVLRIHTTSMSEAQKLVKDLGDGFKISFTKTNPKFIAMLDGNTTDSSKVGAPTIAARSVIPSRSSNRSETKKQVGSNRRDTSAHRKKWWQGQHVCVTESPGLYGLTSDILRRIRTEERCKERKRKYVCVESYGFGGRRPTKTITHHCCSGFHIDRTRTSCQPGSIMRRSELTEPTMLISRGQAPDLGRGPPQGIGDEKLTVFMPNDEVLVEALANSPNDTEVSDSNQVRQFLENHVIPNQMLISTEIQNDQLFTAISGYPIRVNFYPSDLERIMTVNCRKVGVRDVINDNSVVYFIDNIIQPVTESMLDHLARKDEFSEFLSALKETGLDERVVSANGSFTLFAPSNQAFTSIPAAHKTGDCLKTLMRNHIVDHVMCTPVASVHAAHVLTNLGENVTMERRDGTLHVKESEIITSDVMTTNGVIHVINKMVEPTAITAVLDVVLTDSRLSDMMEMLQAAGTNNVLEKHHNFTVIAPTNRAFKKLNRSVIMHLLSNVDLLRNVLKFHVVPGTVTLDDLHSRDSLDTAATGPNQILVDQYRRNIRVLHRGHKRVVRKLTNTLQCARVLRSPKIKPCNGEVLVIDRVLFPPEGPILTILQHESTRSNFSIILDAIAKAGINQIFAVEGRFTFFAPTNKAFQRLAPRVLRLLLSNTHRLAKVIKLHLVEGSHCSVSLLQKPVRLRSKLGTSITSCPKRKRIMLGRRRKRLRARVTESDLIASNGIVYGIDNILLPRRFSLH